MQQIGPYRIQGELGRGGAGVVLQARGPDERQVAIKLLLAHSSVPARKRFQIEVQALARLRHPNVVSILDAGEQEGTPWMALELVEGQSLDLRLRSGPLPIDEAVQVARQLAHALSYVHTCGVLHRDVKPGNVLLRGQQALLTDFGLARDTESSQTRLTASGAFLGSPGYWPPEQARGETSLIGPRSDVYGLGAVLYACLTGHAPVQASSIQEYLTPTLEGLHTTPPHKVRAEVPRWLSDLCMRCLARDPSQRPNSAEEVAQALLVGGQGAGRGMPPSGWVAVAAALTVVVVLGGVLLALNLAPHDPQTPKPPPQATDSPGLVEAPAEQGTDAVRLARLLEEGNRLGTALRYREALDVFEEAVALAPTSAEAHLRCGLVKSRTGRTQEAIEDCDRALALDPRLAMAYMIRGFSKKDVGRFEAALEDFEQARRLTPNDPEVSLHLGEAKRRLGRFDEAIAHYERALLLEPQMAGAYAGRGRVKDEGLRDYPGAIADYTRALELNPNLPDTWVGLGNAEARLERFDEALQHFGRALALDPALASAYVSRGAAYGYQGRFEEAVTDFGHALRLEPTNVFARLNRGSSSFRLGRYDDALQDAELALRQRLTPDLAQRARQLRDEATAALGR